MEVLASVLGSFVAEPARILCASIYSKVRNAFKFKSNLNALIERKNEMNEILKAADKQEKSPNHQVKEWLKEVEGIEQEVNPTQADTAGNGNILCGCCSNCCLHYRLGKKVAEKLEEVNQLMKDTNFPDCILVANRQIKPVEHIRGPVIESQTTASQNLVKIMDLLNDDAVRRIGIWGMGGVGKTTLLRSLNKQLEDTSLQQPFGIVIWVTVSKVFDLETVRTQIAQRLNLEVNYEESRERANKLYQRLEKEKKFLLILDDVWEKIDLDSLGIPQPEIHMGAKIILTSRLLEVCARMLVDAVFKVDVLNDKEAWEMFIKNAGRQASLEHIKPYAEAIAKECGGLPLALITVGAAMRGKVMTEQWKDALNELQRSEPDIIGEIEQEVYKPLRWSYDSLQGKNIKPCFLYCSLFPEDSSIKVSELVQCWMAEGLIDEQQNYEGSLNKGITIIEKLKDSCLLEEGIRENTVKMHDIVRDVAIWIVSSMDDGCKYVVQSGMGLSRISNVEFLKRSKRISFMYNKITTLPDCAIQCPNTSTLLLQGNHFLERVPDLFLQGFQVVRVLNMSGSRIKSLPLSLTQLGELRALVLQNCNHLIEIPPLEGLQKLLVLDLSDTGIRELPKGMEELSNLRQLNLSGTKDLKRIQAGVVTRLSGLEVLDMTGSGYNWGVIGRVEEGEETFEELGCLTRLIVLEIQLGSVPRKDVSWIQRLRSFHISIGGWQISVPKFDERKVKLWSVNLSEKRIGWLVINATHLTLNDCNKIGWMFEDLVTNTQGLAGLKSLTLKLCESLGPFRGCAAPHDLLPNLEELFLLTCFDLECVRQSLVSPLGLGFAKLRLIRADDCGMLKYLIPAELIPYLISLEEIRISDCENLENVFGYENNSSGQIMAADPVLPKLQKLRLEDLPELRSICREKGSWQSLEQIIVIRCNKLMRLPLTSQNANTIKEIRGEQQWWSELKWDDDNTKLALQPHFKPQTYQADISPDSSPDYVSEEE